MDTSVVVHGSAVTHPTVASSEHFFNIHALHPPHTPLLWKIHFSSSQPQEVPPPISCPDYLDKVVTFASRAGARFYKCVRKDVSAHLPRRTIFWSLDPHSVSEVRIHAG
uniref:Uncharacterized protein n=1 Tax=Aegilops tauschii subsp. strangulata TaxID=200361 RepID=A0A453KLZ1_AEGTS